MDLTLDQFAKACGAQPKVAALYFDHAITTMARYKVETPAQVAAYCATMSIETARLTAMEESLYYKDAERLARLYRRVFDLDEDGQIEPDEIRAALPYTRNPKGLSMQLYRGYHGRGGCMLTWEKNYAHHGNLLGLPLLTKPAMLLEPEYAMLIMGSFWDDIRANSVADDMSEVTRRVNGPRRLHLTERIAQQKVALQVLV